MNKRSWLNGVALALLIVLIGGSALAFGSVELWAKEWLRFGALAALAAVIWANSPKEVLGGTAGRVALPVVLLVLWGFLQTVPLPGAVVRVVSPEAAAIYEKTVPPGDAGSLRGWLLEKPGAGQTEAEPPAVLPAEAEDAGDFAVGRSLSIYPFATRRACLSWLTCILLFYVAAHVSRSLYARSKLLWAIGGWTGLLGLMAVVQQVSSSDKILWLRDRPAATRPLGPFVNPNHFAGFVEIGTVVALGLVLAILSHSTGRLSLRSMREAILDREWALPRLVAGALAAVLGLSGLLLSRSTGGLIAFGVGVALLLVTRRLRWAIPVLAAAILVLGVSVGLVSTVGSDARDVESAPFVSSGTDPSFTMRMDAWARTFDVFVDFPIAGTGLGTFEWSFARYQRQGEWLSWVQAHNDYLQLLSETGAVGGLLVIWMLASFIRNALWPSLRAASSRPRWTSVATGAAVVVMLVHSVVDFNLQVPAVAALFSVLVGVLTAAAGDPEEGESSS